MGKYRSEILFGLIAPVGVDLDRIVPLLKDYISHYKYKAHIIRLSRLISKIRGMKIKIENKNEYKRIYTSMTAGNEARTITEQADILARHSIIEIQKTRNCEGPKPGNIYVFRSIKHPEEAKIFRQVYGKGFFLLGFSSSRANRLKYLNRKGMTKKEAETLIERDEGEIDEFGQHTRDAFHMSDVFLDVDSNEFEEHLKRFLHLIFGYPYLTPTKDEFAMFLAFSASFRSADLSRQVGAVITSEGGEIIATGCNDVPKKGGGLYWDGDSNDKRDFKLGYDSNKKMRDEIANKILSNLYNGNKQNVKVEDVFKDTGFFDMTEYGRAVHAEMEALLSCARSNVSPRNGTLYTTTFPCHNCAKHIVASGIQRVVFVEPYPKSKALDLHNDSISLNNQNKKKSTKVIFQPFVGIGPRRFIDIFSLQMGNGVNIKREKNGKIINWKEKLSIFRFPLLGMSYLDKEKSIGAKISKGEQNGVKK